jgi:hypothetical protein
VPKRGGRDLANAALWVWVMRNSTVPEAKRALAEWAYFGRDAEGLQQAARTYSAATSPLLRSGSLQFSWDFFNHQAN